MAKVVVTGGLGFIGSSTVKCLLGKGYEVVVADNAGRLDRNIPKGCILQKADLTDKREALKVMEGADYCIHLAAKIGGLQYLQKYPATIISENNKLCSSVFEAAKDAGIKRIVYISSGMVFERSKVFPVKEGMLKDTPLPSGDYGVSKLIGEWYCSAFHREFGLNYSIARLFNVYGGSDMFHAGVGMAHVIPDLIRKVISGPNPVEILGDGSQIRSYTHVDDAADGIVTLMEHSKAENTDFNISTSQEISILELVRMIWKKSGRQGDLKIKNIPTFNNDFPRRVPDTTKAIEVLGWDAKISIEDGLDETIAQYKEHLKHANSANL